MKLTKFTHACVRLESAGRAVVIDPGEWSEEHALDGVSAVLVTHEHADHLDVTWLTRLAADNPDLRVWAPAPVAENQLAGLGEAVTAVAPGDSFTAGGFPVRCGRRAACRDLRGAARLRERRVRGRRGGVPPG